MAHGAYGFLARAALPQGHFDFDIKRNDWNNSYLFSYRASISNPCADLLCPLFFGFAPAVSGYCYDLSKRPRQFCYLGSIFSQQGLTP